MARYIKTDGSEQEVSPENGPYFSLKELQGYVGGYIEAVKLVSADTMLVNEDGKMQRLPVNKRATLMARAAGISPDDCVVGNVLVCSHNELEQ